jgi:hypothetical protein
VVNSADDDVVVVVGSWRRGDDLERSRNAGEPCPVDDAAVLVGVNDDD